MKAFIIISALCVCWALAAKPEKRHVSQEGKKQEKRVLYDFGTKPNNHLNGHKWSSNSDFGGSGKGYTEKVITKVVEKKIPVPYTVEKHVPYTVEKKVPYKVEVPVPRPYTVEKKVPYPVKEIVKVPYYVPQPYEVVKKVPYQVVVPVPKPYQVNVSIPKPYTVEKRVPYPVKVPVPQPYTVEKQVPYEVKYEVPVPQPYIVEKKVPYEVKIPVHKPYTVHVPKPYPVTVEKHIPVPVEKPVPYEVKVPVDKPYPVEVFKPVPYKVDVPVPSPYTVEKKVPIQVEKPVAVPIKVPVDKPYPVYKEVPVAIKKEVPYAVNIPVHIPIKTSQGNEVNGYGAQTGQYNQWQQQQQHVAEFEHQGYKGIQQSSSINEGTHQNVNIQTYNNEGVNQDLSGKVQLTNNQYIYQNNDNQKSIPVDNTKYEQWQQQQHQEVIGQNVNYQNNDNQKSIPVDNTKYEQWQHQQQQEVIGQNGNYFNYQNNDNQKSIPVDNMKYGQWQQQQHQEVIGQNIDVGFVPNNFELSKQNNENSNYKTVDNKQKTYGNEQTGQEISTKLKMNYDGFNYQTSYQSQNVHNEFQQAPVSHETSLYNVEKSNGINSNHQLNSHQQPQGNYYEQHQHNSATTEEHEGYTYNVPEKSLQIEFGNNPYKQESKQEQIHLSSGTNEKPQQYTRYETRVNHATSKPKQPQSDYVSYAITPQYEHYESYSVSTEPLGYAAHSQSTQHSVENIGSYNFKTNNDGEIKQQSSFQGKEQDGFYSHKNVGQEQYSYTTPAHEVESTQPNNKDFNHNYKTTVQQPTYTHGKNNLRTGKVLVQKQETTKHENHKYPEHEIQQPNYTYETYNNQAVKEDGYYGHEANEQNQQSYAIQGNKPSTHSAGTSNYQETEKGHSYNYESINKGKQQYNAEEIVKPTYHYQAGSSSHQVVEHGEYTGKNQNQYHSNSEQQQQQQQQPIYATHNEANQQLNFESTKHHSSSGFSSHPSEDHGQYYENYATHQVEQQPTYFNNGGTYYQSNQGNEATKYLEYGSHDGSANKQTISKEEEHKIKGWN